MILLIPKIKTQFFQIFFGGEKLKVLMEFILGGCVIYSHDVLILVKNRQSLTACSCCFCLV